MLFIVELIKELFGLAGVIWVVGFRELLEFAWELRGGDGSVALRVEGGKGGEKRGVGWEGGELRFWEEGSGVDVVGARNRPAGLAIVSLGNRCRTMGNIPFHCSSFLGRLLFPYYEMCVLARQRARSSS